MTARSERTRSDLNAFGKLELTVRRQVDGTQHGDHQGLTLGPGSQAEELVAYQPGHDVRRIDWNATARAGEPQVWLTRAERALDTWILLDRSPSMAFGTSELEKSEVATWSAAALGMLRRGAQDRVGVGLLEADGLRWLRPGSGRSTSRRVLRTPEAQRAGPMPMTLGQAISRMVRQAPRPGIRIIVSDLLDADGAVEGPFEWEEPLRRLCARHDVIVIEVVDVRDLDLPDVGELLLIDPESGTQRLIATSDRKLRNDYRAAALQHRVATERALRSAGAGHLRITTEDDLPRVLARFIHRRRSRPARTSRRGNPTHSSRRIA